MSVNSPGISAPKTPPPPPPVNRSGQQNQGANTAAQGAAATAKANSPSANAAPPPAAFVPSTNAGPGGTTSPGPNIANAGAKGLAQATPPPISAQANAMAAMMNNAQGAAFLAGGKASSETKRKSSVGDAKEDSGDVKVESESEARGAQALQDTSGELGQGGEMGAATGAGATST